MCDQEQQQLKENLFGRHVADELKLDGGRHRQQAAGGGVQAASQGEDKEQRSGHSDAQQQ